MAEPIKVSFEVKTILPKKNKNNLVIFFPGAGTEFDDYRSFLSRIEEVADLVFVERGYFGLIMDNRDMGSYSTNHFVKSFYKQYLPLILRYKNVLLISHSFGGFQAVRLHKLLPKSRLILVSPPITEGKYKCSNFERRTLRVMAKTRGGRAASELFDRGQLMTLGKYLPNKVVNEVAEAACGVGVKSYLNCLYEIIKLGVVKKVDVSEDTIIIIGENDPFLSRYCIQDSIKKRPKTYLLKAGHSILQKHGNYVFDHIVKTYLD